VSLHNLVTNLCLSLQFIQERYFKICTVFINFKNIVEILLSASLNYILTFDLKKLLKLFDAAGRYFGYCFQ